MEQFFYTKEGKKYSLKMASNNTTSLITVAASQAYPALAVNVSEALVPASAYVLKLNTAKKIIPIQMGVYFSISNVAVVDIQSCYYFNTIKPPAPTVVFDYQSALAKMVSLIDREEYTTPNMYKHSMKYDQAIFENNDFIDCNNGKLFYFLPSSSAAFSAKLINNAYYQVPVGSYTVCISLIYFELE